MNLTDRLTTILRQRLQQLGFTSLRAFRETIAVSEWQLRQLRNGKIQQMRLEVLLKLAQGLQWSLEDVIAAFSVPPIPPPEDTIAALPPEGDRQQQDLLKQAFETSSLQTLESWLIQWSAAANAVRNNPDLPASRLLPLMKPIEQLLQEWGVEAIAAVGEEIDYNPQWHQLMQGVAQPGQKVRVRYAGYLHRGKLLHRAQVSIIS
jgi:DNA-binding Xre family transcriptional regulator